jgi:hypothetical protein
MLEIRRLQRCIEVYLQDGRFERDRMLRCVSEVIEQGQSQGYPQTRIAGHAEWTSHPLVILGGGLQVNPFFVPPDKFLCELRERRATPSASPAHSG